MSDLADFSDSTLSRLSNVVARLEKRGWVRRTPDPADGRYTLAILTDKGWAKVVETAPGHVEEVRRVVFAPLTKAQQHQLGAVCRRILGAIDPAACTPEERLRALMRSDPEGP
jgi:DNA-binding MarR family transcriptional regulator